MSVSLRNGGGDDLYKPLSEINVTPLVDVMLVLLIIFMVAAPLLTTGVTVDLPRASATAAWPAPLSIRGQPGGFAVVPLAHRGYARFASRHVYRPVRVSHDRFRE